MMENVRRMRLENDYKQMQNLRGRVIDWRPLVGEPPYVEEYLLTVNVRTIIGPKPVFRDRHELRLVLPRDYPQHAPQTYMLTQPSAFHPNWYMTDSRWCYGTWNISEPLAHYVLRCVRSLQYDPEITNENSPANVSAGQWYMRHLYSGLFPCDTQAMPSPEKEKLTFRIQNIKQ